jgi:recombination protein RecA
VKGNLLLKKTIEQLEKKFSKKDFITFGTTKQKIEPVPSGVFSLDLALGIGGWPRGRIVEIYGPESSGKTSLALASIKAYQDWQDQTTEGRELHGGRVALVIDAEHTMVGSFFKSMGVDMDRVLYCRVDTAEEAFQTLLDLGKTGQVGFVLLDSIDALQNQRQLQRDVSEVDVGGISKDTSRFFREYSKIAAENDITSIFLNQLKYNPGARMGNPETTSGGTALKFYSSVRLKTLPQKPSTEVANAFMGRLKIVKNKCSPPIAAEINYHFVYARGVDKPSDLMLNAKTLGIIRHAGQSTLIRTGTGDSDWETLWSTGGKAGFVEALRTNPDMMQKLETMCYSADKELAGTIDDDDSDSIVDISED